MLVAVDGQSQTGNIVDRAIELASALSAKILLLYVIVEKEVPRGYEDIHGDSIPEHYYQEQYHRATDEQAEKIRKAGIEFEGMCGTGDPKFAILSTSKSKEVSFVVLGVRSFRHQGRLRGEGNVAKEVMEGSAVPVIAIP